jgi:hypothetical protein
MLATFTAYAPPSIWGTWQTIYNSMGSRSFTLSFSAVGDTQVKGKVRYFGAIGKVEQEFFEQIVFASGDAIANIEVCFKGIPLGSTVDGSIS